MAQSVTIDIIANFVDNASSKVEGLNKKLDNLEAAAKRLYTTLNSGEKLSTGLFKTSAGLKSVSTSLNENISNIDTYKTSLKSTAANLAEKQSKLTKVKQAYDINTDAIQSNLNSLQKEKKSIELSMGAKQNEISMIEKSNAVINKGSLSYKDNVKAITQTKNELADLETRYNAVNKSISSNQSAMQREVERYSTAKEYVRGASKEYESLNNTLNDVKKSSVFGKISGFMSGTGGAFSKAVGVGGILKDNILSDIGSFTDKIFNVKNLMMGAVTGAAAHGFVVNPVSYADEMTTASIGLETMLGSKDLAKEMIGELQDFAAKTPFDTKGLISASQQILRAGIATDPDGIKDILNKVGNSAAAAGQGTEGVQGIVTALQQMSMAGRVNAQDMMQLTNRGVKAWQYVADGLGVSLTEARKLSENGAISATDAIEYILKGMDEYDGMMDKVSNRTTSGLKSNIKDTIQNKIELPWGEGLQSGLTEGLGEVADWLDTINPELEQAGKNINLFAKELSSGVIDKIKGLAEFEINIIGGEQFQNADGVGEKMGVLLQRNIEGAFEKHPVASSAISAWIIGKGASKIKGIGSQIINFIGKDSIKSMGSKIATSFSGSGVGATVASGIVSSPLALMAGIAVAGQAVLNTIDKVQKHSYLSSLNFTKDLKINQGALTEYTNQWKELNDLKWERNDLTDKLNSGDFSEPDTESLKNRIQEIDDILAKEYNLDISCDTSELDSAIDKAHSLSELQMAENINSLQNGFGGFKDTKNELYNNTFKSNEAKERKKQILNNQTKVSTLKNRHDAGTITDEEYINSAKEITGTNFTDVDQIDTAITSKNGGFAAAINQQQQIIDNTSEAIDKANESLTKFRGVAVESANTGLESFKRNKAKGLDTSQDLFNIDTTMQNSDLNKSSYAGELAAAQTGFDDFQSAVEAGGDTLGEVTANAMDNMQRWGASGPQIAETGGLIANGFKTMQDALNSTDENALTNVEADINKYAESMNLIDKDQHIELSVSGDLSVVDDITGKIEEVNTAGGLNITVDANGDVSVLDEAGAIVDDLENRGAVALEVNASGNFDVLDEFGQIIAEIDKETGYVHEIKCEVNTQMSTEELYSNPLSEIDVPGEVEVSVTVKPKFELAVGNLENSFSGLPQETPITMEGVANYKLGEYPTDAPNVSGKANYTGTFFPPFAPTIRGIAIYRSIVERHATGTRNARGGMAMVNDDGSPQPQELIEHNGEFVMYEGRNVIVPLSPGDKVYPSWETKSILSGESIPKYAKGLNNEIIDRKTDVIHGVGSSGANISVGGITVSISVDGSKGNVVEEIKSHSTEIAEVITGVIEKQLTATFVNSKGGAS